MGSSHSVPKSTKPAKSTKCTNRSSKRWSLRSSRSITPEPSSPEPEKRLSDIDLSQYLWYPPERKPFIKPPPKHSTMEEKEAKRKKYEVARVLLHDASLRNRQYVLMKIPLYFEMYEKLDGTRYRVGEYPVYSPSNPDNVNASMTANCKNTTKGFFSLPPELRQQIYSYIFPPSELQSSPIPLCYFPDEQVFRYPPIRNPYSHVSEDAITHSRQLNRCLLVCRLFNNEMTEYLYGWRSGFEVHNNAYAFIQHIGPHNARYIRHFRMSWKEGKPYAYPHSTIINEQEIFRRLCSALKFLERATISITVTNLEHFYNIVHDCMSRTLKQHGLETKVRVKLLAKNVYMLPDYSGRNLVRDMQQTATSTSLVEQLSARLSAYGGISQSTNGSFHDLQCLKGCDKRCHILEDKKSEWELRTKINTLTPILSLPIEARRRIYDYVITHTRARNLSTHSDPSSDRTSSTATVSSAVTIRKGGDGYHSTVSNGHKAPTRCALYSIMFACRQTYAELHDKVYQQTHFHIPAQSLSWLELIPSDNLKLIRKLALSYDADSPKGVTQTKNPTGNLRTLNSKIHMFASHLESWTNSSERSELGNLELWIHRFSMPFFYYLRSAMRRLISVAEDFNHLEKAQHVNIRIIAYDYVNDDEVYWTENMTDWILEKEEPYAWDCDTRTWKTWDVVQEKARNCEPMTALEYARICEWVL